MSQSMNVTAAGAAPAGPPSVSVTYRAARGREQELSQSASAQREHYEDLKSRRSSWLLGTTKTPKTKIAAAGERLAATDRELGRVREQLSALETDLVRQVSPSVAQRMPPDVRAAAAAALRDDRVSAALADERSPLRRAIATAERLPEIDAHRRGWLAR